VSEIPREEDEDGEEGGSDSSLSAGHWYTGYRSPLPASIQEEEMETRDRTMSFATEDAVAALHHMSDTAVTH
jgi:hypothetical protein